MGGEFKFFVNVYALQLYYFFRFYTIIINMPLVINLY